MPLIQVALATPLNRLFDYWIVAGEPRPPIGVRVKVPFGRQQKIGVVVGLSSHSDFDANRIKPALAYLDSAPLFSSQELKFLRWVASYYHQPLGLVIDAALPSLLRQGQGLYPATEPRWHLTALGRTTASASLARAKRQADLLEFLQQAVSPPTQKALQAQGFTLAVIRGLEEKNCIELVRMPPKKVGIGLPDLPTPEKSTSVLAQPPLTLTEEQSQVVQQLREQLGSFQASLIEGVTGSGKTEVYLQLIQQVLEQGQQALVLVPEISLTPQTLARFEARFNRPVVALHSGLTDTQRLAAWRQAFVGKAAVVLGTRSAIFTPMPRLGVIIVDEEHDPSFKQQDGLRYQARDLAVMRASQMQVPVVLGSATPSLESLAQVLAGNYCGLELKQRPNANTEPPSPKLLDIRSRYLQGGFSEPLLQALDQHLTAGNQVLVLINRRGYAPVLMCGSCGWIAGCLSCDARMTLHREPEQLSCHHCDKVQPPPLICPQCQQDDLLSLGVGTQKAEEVLAERYPEIPIIRLDRDTVRTKDQLTAKLDLIHQSGPAILLGTQMLAKGHHFPRVTLATLLNADQGLYSSDPRAIERTAQLIIQVAGRAGRAEQPGQVIIQTHHSDDPRLGKLCVEGYHALALDLLEERRASQWPPYAYLALIRAEAIQSVKVQEFMQQLAEQAQALNQEQLSLLGPVPAPMERRQGRYQMQLIVHGLKRAPLHRLVAELFAWLETAPVARQVRWSIDIDPEDLF